MQSRTASQGARLSQVAVAQGLKLAEVLSDEMHQPVRTQGAGHGDASFQAAR
jgi:hypothetical protein